MGYLDGFGVIIKKWAGVNTPSGARVTVEYPEEVRPKPERFHGRHVLNRYEDGMEKCIGCELCAGVCPAKCIYVRGADNDPENPTSPGERFGYVYEINYLRCIHCDLCVEACPTEAITETKLFEFSFTNRADAIYTKKELVVGDDGRPQQLPWENWDGGFDPAQDASGWMRATSPGGDADFKGIVAWAGELGYGVRPPERASVLEEVGAVPAGSPVHAHPLDHVDQPAIPHVDSQAAPLAEPADDEAEAPDLDLTAATVGAAHFDTAGSDSADGVADDTEAADQAAAGSSVLGDQSTYRPANFNAGDRPASPEDSGVEADSDSDSDAGADAEAQEVAEVEVDAEAATDDAATAEDPAGTFEDDDAAPDDPPVHRAGYFDAPEADADKDKKKRRFFK